MGPEDIPDSSEELIGMLLKFWEAALDSVVTSTAEKLDSEEACPGTRWDIELTGSIELKLVVILLKGTGITTLRVPPVTSLTAVETSALGLLDAVLVGTAEWVPVVAVVLLTGTEPVLEAEDVFRDGAERMLVVVLFDLTRVPTLLSLEFILVAWPMTATDGELELELDLPVVTAPEVDKELLLVVPICLCPRIGLTAVVAFALVLVLVLVLELVFGLELELVSMLELILALELPVVTALEVDKELLLVVPISVCARTGLTAVVAFALALALALALGLELVLELELVLVLVFGIEMVLVIVLVLVLVLGLELELVLVLELELELDAGDELLLLDVVP